MQPWEQREDESNAAYARFLVYRNLGPTRTLQRAYELQQEQIPVKYHTKSNHQWKADSAEFDWRERSSRWDIHNFLEQGEETAALYMEAMRLHARNVYYALAKMEPTKYDEIIRSLELLGKLFPPEVLAQIIEQHRTSE